MAGLEGRVAAVTGGGSGIGDATRVRLAGDGAVSPNGGFVTV